MSTTLENYRLEAMVIAFASVFAMSHAFRTLASIMVGQIEVEFNVDEQEIAIFSASFHLSFAVIQLAMGAALDRFGPKQTVLVAFPVAIAGSLLSTLGTSFAVIVIGQGLIGLGCAPALLAVLVFIDRRYPSDQFARISGLVMSFAGMGMLFTGTPLAWVVQEWSWRGGFLVMTMLGTISWFSVMALVDDPITTTPEKSKHQKTPHHLSSVLIQSHTVGSIGRINAAFSNSIEYFEGIKPSSTCASTLRWPELRP